MCKITYISFFQSLIIIIYWDKVNLPPPPFWGQRSAPAAEQQQLCRWRRISRDLLLHSSTGRNVSTTRSLNRQLQDRVSPENWAWGGRNEVNPLPALEEEVSFLHEQLSHRGWMTGGLRAHWRLWHEHILSVQFQYVCAMSTSSHLQSCLHFIKHYYPAYIILYF